jgi:crotonobetainyl-CoA:carnitine CoA-transferase CaiB-like acyl-CoA transferase
MTRTPLLLALVAAAALAGCNRNNDDHTIVAGPDGDVANEAPATNEPVTLPPSIQASKIYRCKDNSVVYIDWLSDQKTANFRSAQGDTPVMLTAPEPGTPLAAEGYSLTGTADGSSVTLERPGKGRQTCKA